MSRFARILTASLLILTLASCDDLPEWMGGSDSKVPLPGKRIPVLLETTELKADPELASVAVLVPDIKANDNWRQAGGAPQGMSGNLQLSSYTHHDSARIGDGNGWEEPLYPNPIVAGNVVYAMDSRGYVTAHVANDIGTIKWTSKSLVGEDEPDVLGGGLAFDGGRIYGTSGRGAIVALDAATGKELWKKTLGIPLRAAPKVAGGKVYALSVDNQLFALNAADGASLWSHRGINENSGFLASISPALTDSIAVVGYSSGELHGLDTNSGQDVWTDSLIRSHRTSATGGFFGIGGNPIVKDDVVYAAGSNGYLAAISLLNGRRIWEADVSSLNTPWISGDYLYLISTSNQLVCLQRTDGRVRWVAQLPRFEDEEKHKHPLVWRGPIMANDQLLIAGINGQMLVITPKDGSMLATVEIPEDVTDAPIVAGGRLYLLTQNAKLHVYY